MNIAAYCRVSTDSADQLNSLDAQKRFFAEYCAKTGETLARMYADEGISGTKVRNRREFLKMMEDAERGLFELVVVKDISRFARNTVDLLQNIRRLKTLGIETLFLTANMTSMGSSEFVLTIFGALAQEESANTSKRVKFGKRVNAEKGRVPNIVYGYDKTAGDFFNLRVNEAEAALVRRIFALYTDEGHGAFKIAALLNESDSRTKRGNRWSQNAVCRVLTNELYSGLVVNGKQEVADFLTGQRVKRDAADWMVHERPDLRIVEPEVFERVQEIKRSRGQTFKVNGGRHSNKHLFSTLIKCSECGWSFRRTLRTYKNTYVRWVCSGHNERGAASCQNAVTLDEDEMIGVLQTYFVKLLGRKENTAAHMVRELERLYRAKGGDTGYERELCVNLERLRRSRQKYMDMYADDLITRDELNERIGASRGKIAHLEGELHMLAHRQAKYEHLQSMLRDTFRGPEDIIDVRRMTNAQIKSIVQKIEVDRHGGVDIFLRPLN